ncbi:hypothetical protein [Methanoregula formicica]|uniref:Uncharacterized protein n=1 Tax=Methanoregula formicica (strain DSM 22288 / NBRC 105244 / SMSP) TaxID=593750 RepID=L0HGR0_METFS|nr:hypothetical protein [Methanoregula formicica]AGB02254.1 hypothetical protein Metfor_1211 [Methanoregula formicica SMSP]
MQLRKLSVILLALLLAGMVMVPMVSAANDATIHISSAQLAEESRMMSVDVSKIPVRDLTIDDNVEKVTVKQSLTSEEGDGISTISPGSIIRHSKDNITRVFDGSGKQVLYANDDEAALVPTPSGKMLPASRIHQVPSGAFLKTVGTVTYVISGGEVLFTVINDRAGDMSDEKALADTNAVLVNPDFTGWIEDAFDNNVPQIGYFSAYWVAPSHPPSSESQEAIFLFNAIQPSAGNAIIQPVLEWNQPSTGLYWTGAAWSLRNGVGYPSSRVRVNDGETVRGQMVWRPSMNAWLIMFTNGAGQTVSKYTTDISTDRNLATFVALEGTKIDDNTDVPGDTTFSSMQFLSGLGGSTVPIVWGQNINPNAPLTQLRVQIISNPSSVKLHTAN